MALRRLGRWWWCRWRGRWRLAWLPEHARVCLAGTRLCRVGDSILTPRRFRSYVIAKEWYATTVRSAERSRKLELEAQAGADARTVVR